MGRRPGDARRGHLRHATQPGERPPLQPPFLFQPADHALAALKILTSYRADLVGQRVASLYRLQQLLTGISPALERSADFNRKGPLMALAYNRLAAATGLLSHPLPVGERGDVLYDISKLLLAL